ncbi:hypothetical protein [Nocardioides sp. InS609-2]|uniref:hypothetical protein n=1 Tax=Nocardioides sp. InS609-2 TaxID=2760705 RepID=UPI0020BE6026|nr:hypothetical protein [Nocardioides sp. InS609-2]
MYGARTTSSDHRRQLGDPVVAAGLLMVLLAAGFRAWALYPSWFYLDDYNLLRSAAAPLTVENLLEPYNGHLMPGGRLLFWLAGRTGPLPWPAVATMLLGLQVVAWGAALWMLVRVFGRRWGILVPLAAYLFSAITLPATMWASAAVNQLPQQAALLVAIGAWVEHLRGRGTRWLALTLAALAVGLCFYVKTIAVVPVLLVIALGWFSTGRPLRRTVASVRRTWPALVGLALLTCAYLAYYLTQVPQITGRTDWSILDRLSDSMLTSFVSGVVGGPWRWTDPSPPTAFADPPSWAAHGACVVFALVVLHAALTRVRTLRAWLLLGLYLGGLIGLLLTSRASSFTSLIGFEYRYLTDSAAIAALCLAFAYLEVPGALGSSSPRTQPLFTGRTDRRLVVALTCLVAVSGLASSVPYVAYWHEGNASEPYLRTLARERDRVGIVDLADSPVPDDVMSQLAAPDNKVSSFAALLGADLRFPDSSGQLGVVDSDGTIHRALVEPGVVSEDGPREGCGWPVTDRGRDIPLTGAAFPWGWWLQIGYLASADSPVTVSAGGSRIDTDVQSGLNTVYVMLDGTFDEVRIDGLDADVTLCVDTIIVGQPVPGEVLE